MCLTHVFPTRKREKKASALLDARENDFDDDFDDFDDDDKNDDDDFDDFDDFDDDYDGVDRGDFVEKELERRRGSLSQR